MLPKHGWESQAACLDDDPENWFPHTMTMPRTVQDAIEVCGWCPVRLDCLTVAIRDKHDYGIWGGLLPEQRKTLARRLQRNRHPLMLKDLDGLTA